MSFHPWAKRGGERIRAGITAAGIIVLIVGLIGLGASAAYASIGGEVTSSVVAAIGVIAGGVGAASKGKAQ